MMSAIPQKQTKPDTPPTGAAGQRPVALVTGASAGIGLATASRLAEAGYRVALLARNAGRLAEAAADIAQAHPSSAPALTIPADVADHTAAAAAVREALARFGRLDVVVNNAGYAPLKPIAETTADDYAACFAVNAVGPAAIIAAAWSAFVSNHERNEPGGRVVNVTTLATHDPFPGFAAYAAAKSAAGSLARSVKNEGAPIGVLAFNIAPGAVETRMLRGLFDESVLPADAALNPDEVAQLVLACAVGTHDEHNGKTIYVSRDSRGVAATRIADA